MALLKRSSRGLWLPGGQPTIDWTNPLTAGLVGCWVATGEGGSVPVIRDLVTQTKLVKVGSGPVSISAGPTGLQAKDAPTNSGWTGPLAVSQQPKDAFSVFWFGSILNAGTNLANNPFFICTVYGNGITSPFLGPSLGRNVSGTAVVLYTNNGTFQQNVASGATSGASGNYAFLGSAKPGGSAYIWSNGKIILSASSPAGAISWASPTVTIGTQVPANSSNAGAGMSVGALWNRQLTPGESALISADPTNFLLFPGDIAQSFFVGSHAAAALAAALAAASTTTAALTTAIPLLATPAASAVVNATMSTSIRLAAALAGASTTTAALTTGIVLQAAAAATAAAGAALTTAIQLASALASVSSATGSLTTAIRLAASLFAVGTGSGTLTSFVGLSRTSPHLGVRQRMIARKGRNIILRRGGMTIDDTPFRAFVHAFSGREITEELKQGDQHVETLADVTPVVGDKLLIGGRAFSVLGVGVLYDGDTLLGYSLWVRG